MSIIDRIVSRFRRKPKTPPIALDANGHRLLTGMSVRLPHGGAGIHKIHRILDEKNVEIMYSDGVTQVDMAKSWVGVGRGRRRKALRRR